jgi:hypothetical protein
VLVWKEEDSPPSLVDFDPLSATIDETPLNSIGVKKMLSYMLKACSLSKAYHNEFSDLNRREFNLQAKECLYTFYRLNYGDQLNKGKQKIAKSGIKKLEAAKKEKKKDEKRRRRSR